MNPVAKMQEEIAARLNADPYFADITVITEREADIVNKIDRALKLLTVKESKIGVAIVVGAFSSDADSPDLPGPHFANSSTDVTIFENPTFNSGATGTGKAAVDIAVRVTQLLHHYYAGGIGQTLLISGKDCIDAMGETPPGSGVIVYKVKPTIPMDAQVLDKVLACTISPSGGAVPQDVTLTCSTTGASIYYTLDYSYPWSDNAAATLYQAPFTVSAAAMLRVVAHKTDNAASDAAFAVFV